MDLPADFRPLQFSTDELPVRDRVPVWREIFGPRMFGADVEPAGGGAFRARVTTRLLPGFRLVATESSPARFARTRRFLADGRDHFGLHLSCCKGTVGQRSRDVACGPGDAVALNAAEPGAFASPSTARFYHLWFPRAELAPLVARLDDAVLRRIGPESEALRYLVGYVRFLEEQQKLADPALARAASGHVRDLFALLLGATGDAAALAARRGLRAARMQAIKRYIADSLGSGRLTLSGVAAHHGVGPRYVQRLFESEGTTFSEYVLNERLALASHMLTDPAHAGWTVSSIALEAGFGDVSYFNRRFRRRYGLRPSDVRGRT
jgi:AraC-like DNA-binding protein